MYTKEQARKEALASLKKALGKKFPVSPDMLVTPPNLALGDLSFACFQLAKGQGRNPAEIASELAAQLAPSPLIKKITAAGPYVNFVFDDAAFASSVLRDVATKRKRYGHGSAGKGKKVLVEYAQPNTHKEFHVGHIRNAVLGQAIVNVLKANGYETVAASYIGDIGAHVAKAVWGLEKFVKADEIPKEDRARVLGEVYTEATRYVDEHPEAKEEIAEVQRKLEADEEPWYSLWRETREWSLAAFRDVFGELGVKPDVWYYESQVEKPGKELVKKMLTDGIARKSEGATIVDLEEEKLGVFLVLKSDGSSLYATKDLALAFRKDEEFHADRQIFVIDVRQSLYMKQLFAALQRMGFTPELVHVGYEMVTLPEGAMSSRKGNIVRYEDLRDAMREKLVEETAKRHADWRKKKVEKNAAALAQAAMVFTMLRQDPGKQIVFDMDEAMSIDGFTGPYLLYTIARINSIEAKADMPPILLGEHLTHEHEKAMLRIVADYPSVVAKAAATFQVSAVAQEAFALAKKFAEYYHEVRILEDENHDRRGARLALIAVVRQTLTNACELLGIQTVKEM
ncbi:arginine--tRNA ligase [Candidatus Uhrbacteria bacterium]|nr:arginine--tRNA ligase [Candidatus Uhrbacteria bacterium]